MISVKEAVELIQGTKIPIKTQKVRLESAYGKILSEEIKADRPFPPYDRVTMDGIAINYKDFEKGIRSFIISHRQLAGQAQSQSLGSGYCIEIMTGSICPKDMNTIIRYEDIEITDQEGERKATLNIDTISQGQNIHLEGSDRKKGEILISKLSKLESPEIAVAASSGYAEVEIICQPKIAIVSTGDELIPIDHNPLPHQIRRSNGVMLQSALINQGISSDVFHFPDEVSEIKNGLLSIANDYQLCILSGGVSMGKADYVPLVLSEIGVEKVFHKVKQRPGKPFWFGRKADRSLVVFALPGNPVSSFVGLHKYVTPWIKSNMGLAKPEKSLTATLIEGFHFSLPLTYFLQVSVSQDEDGKLMAKPFVGGGSGDHANLIYGNGLLELSANQNEFKAGDSFPLILYRDSIFF